MLNLTLIETEIDLKHFSNENYSYIGKSRINSRRTMLMLVKQLYVIFGIKRFATNKKQPVPQNGRLNIANCFIIIILDALK